MGFRVW